MYAAVSAARFCIAWSARGPYTKAALSTDIKLDCRYALVDTHDDLLRDTGDDGEQRGKHVAKHENLRDGVDIFRVETVTELLDARCDLWGPRH